jgi:cytochrome c biogenesis protein CcdA
MLAGEEKSLSKNDCTPYHILYPDPSSHYVVVGTFVFFYTIVFLFGLFGNLAIIVITVTHRNLQTVQNIFILNLAASGVILCTLSIPLTPITHIYKQWYN